MLLSVDQALERILTHFSILSTETVPLAAALGRVTAQGSLSADDIPPFANSSMDGFAIRAADIAGASADHPSTLQVVADILAGDNPKIALGAGQAARIMTGAILPDGADAVIPVEQTNAAWELERSFDQPYPIQCHIAVSSGAYVRPAGEDMKRGQVVIPAGALIRPEEIGILASIGLAVLPVVRAPRVAILSTGNELVGVDQPLERGKIRDSNSYALAAALTANGAQAIRIPTALDTRTDVRRRFLEALETQPDLIISSAGVSVGVFDVVRSVIDELGQVDFWKINLRPGKPLAFGNIRGIPFFGLPGNPVSALVTFDIFVRPSVLKLGGRADTARYVQAYLDEPVRCDGRRTYLRVRLQRDGDSYRAHLTGTQSSGAFSSLLLADGLMIISETERETTSGKTYPVRLLRDNL